MTGGRVRRSSASQTAAASSEAPTEIDSDGFETLRQLVADRHSHQLSRDDPIAMLQTVNELLVTQAAKTLEHAQHAVVTKFCHELEFSVAAWKREAKEVGERTLEAARRVGAEQITEAKQELIEALSRERRRATAAMRRWTLLNAIVLLATALCILGARWLQ